MLNAPGVVCEASCQFVSFPAPPGNGSLNEIPVARSCPMLETVTVKPAVSPAFTTGASATFDTVTSGGKIGAMLTFGKLYVKPVPKLVGAVRVVELTLKGEKAVIPTSWPPVKKWMSGVLGVVTCPPVTRVPPVALRVKSNEPLGDPLLK